MTKMSLGLLIRDEFKGFYKSKVMMVLWIGMPLLSLVISYLSPDTEEIPLSVFVSLMVSSLSGTLAAVMLSTTIVSEKERHVYDLFLIRPVKRWHLMFSKFVAVYVCIMIATVLSILLGLVVDLIKTDIHVDILLDGLWDSLAVSMSAMAISCSFSILIGLLVNSTMVAAILAIYAGNQLSMVAVLPGIFFSEVNTVLYSLSVGILLALIVNIAIAFVIDRKML
ncbi:MAG: ABC transporter permease [Promethearchaeota archaeon]